MVQNHICGYVSGKQSGAVGTRFTSLNHCNAGLNPLTFRTCSLTFKCSAKDNKGLTFFDVQKLNFEIATWDHFVEDSPHSSVLSKQDR